MASSGWQGNKDFPYYNPDLKCNLYIYSISHNGTTLRVAGSVGAVCPHTQNYYAYYTYPVYVTAGGNGVGTEKKLLDSNERVYGDSAGTGLSTAKYVTFDVTINNVSASTTSYNFPVYIRMNNGQNVGTLYWTITFSSSSGTAPTGLSISNISATTNTVTATVSVTGWGGVGDATTRYREVSVMASANTYAVRRYDKVYSNTMSSAITVSNSSTHGSMTIVPNTQYWLYWVASNGTYHTQSPIPSTTAITTMAPAPTLSNTGKTYNSATFSYSVPNQGGAYYMYLQYKIGSGSWVTGATLTGSGAKSGTLTIGGLDPTTTYAFSFRILTTAGASNGNSINVTTNDSPFRIYGSVGGKTKRIRKVYCSVSGKTKKVRKIYTSVNGKTKLIYQSA